MTNLDTSPALSRENVVTLHGVYCYRDRASDTFDTRDKWAGRCICHHAVWHSCPDREAGKRIFEGLPAEHSATSNSVTTNAAIGAYLRAWADEVEHERKTWTDMWGPNFRHMTPTKDMLDRAGRLGTKAAELRSRADEVDPPCVACRGRGEHAAWCEPRFREPAAIAAGGES